MYTTLADTVASSNATTDIAYFVCIVSFLVAGGVAIYLLLDKIKQHNSAPAKKSRAVRSTKSTTSKVSAKKLASNKAAVKKTTTKQVTKKPVKRVTKKK